MELSVLWNSVTAFVLIMQYPSSMYRFHTFSLTVEVWMARSSMSSMNKFATNSADRDSHCTSLCLFVRDPVVDEVVVGENKV